MRSKVVVVGAGGFGRETVDVLEAINASGGDNSYEIAGVMDDNPTDANLDRLAARGCRFLGGLTDWFASDGDAMYLIGIGNPTVRRLIAQRFDAAGYMAATAVHPSVTFGPLVVMEPGCVVCAGVRMTNNIHIGRHVHVNLNATIGHDTTISDYVSINPLVSVSGDCTIGEAVMLGTGSVLLQGLEVGDEAVVGASACVVRDVPAGVTVKGIPAR